jgi:hypothetical protein
MHIQFSPFFCFYKHNGFLCCTIKENRRMMTFPCLCHLAGVNAQAHFPFQHHFWNQILVLKVNTSIESIHLLLFEILRHPYPRLSMPLPGLCGLGSAKWPPACKQLRHQSASVPKVTCVETTDATKLLGKCTWCLGGKKRQMLMEQQWLDVTLQQSLLSIQTRFSRLSVDSWCHG